MDFIPPQVYGRGAQQLSSPLAKNVRLETYAVPRWMIWEECKQTGSEVVKWPIR